MGASTGLAAFAELGDLVGVDILNPSAGDWMILDDTGSIAIKPDTVAKFEYRNEGRVSDYPMEQGAFDSYNKVATPFQIRMLMVCSGGYVQDAESDIKNALGIGFGGNFSSRGDFLSTINAMLAANSLLSIVTPDMVYKSVTLEHYDYRKESSDGATMLKVEAWFREIRVNAGATYSTSNSPSAASPADLGTVHTGDTVTVSFPGLAKLQ